MPIRERISVASTSGPLMSVWLNRIRPSILALGTRSFILFMHLNKVLLPHPDGPISAVTLLGLTSMSMFVSAWN